MTWIPWVARGFIALCELIMELADHVGREDLARKLPKIIADANYPKWPGATTEISDRIKARFGGDDGG